MLQLPLVEPSVNDVCRTINPRIIDTAHRRSKYTSYSKYYWEHVESISVLRVLAVRTLSIPTDEILQVYLPEVPALVQNLEIHEALAVSAAVQTRNTARKHEVPTILSRKYLVLSIGSNYEWLGYVRTPHMSAPKLRDLPSMRKNTQLVRVRINSAW